MTTQILALQNRVASLRAAVSRFEQGTPDDLVELLLAAEAELEVAQAAVGVRLDQELANIEAWDAHEASKDIIGKSARGAQVAEERELLALSKLQPTKPRARGEVYSFMPAGVVMRCESRRCNAHVLCRDTVKRKVMKLVPLDAPEAFYAASPEVQETLPHRKVQVELTLCPACAGEMDGDFSGRGHERVGLAAIEALPAEQRALPQEFWRQRFGRVKPTQVTSDAEAQRDHFHRTVRRQG